MAHFLGFLLTSGQLHLEHFQSGQPLIGEGAKVQTDWLHDFLLNPYPIRPAVFLRMPKFNMSSAEATALVDYFAAHKNNLSPESQLRLEKNPLRILDSKQEQDKGIVAGAPKLDAHLTENAASWFARVQESLASIGISYMVSPRLVRGLDYYAHTVWEIKTDALGAQDTVLAGGRYDGLVAQMGGPEIPGVGWAAGIERLALLLEAKGRKPEEAKPLAVAIPLSDLEEKAAFGLVEALRKQNIRAEMLPPGALGKRLKKADKFGARYALVLGETEVRDGTVTLRDLKEGTQKTVKHEEIFHTLG